MTVSDTGSWSLPTGEAAGDADDDPRFARLLDVTRTMAGQGYDAVSMREVAREAQMSLATIYQYVGSKDQLIAEAHAGGMRRFRDRMVANPPRGASAEQRVRAVVRAILTPLADDEQRARTLMRALYSGDPAVRASQISTADSFRLAIDAAFGEDRVRDRRVVTETIGLVMQGVILGWLSGRFSGDEVLRTVDRAIKLVFRGCREP